jgi:hypothetical protein
VAGKSNIPTELEFLSSLEDGEVVTQMRLSQRVAVSVGLINALLKRATHKGYVKAKSAPYKRYAYYLTPQGFSEKCRLVGEYLESSLSFFRMARKEYAELFIRAHATGQSRFGLVGVGELAEIGILAAREANVELVCVLDGDTDKSQFLGLPVVRSCEEASGIDAFVITDARVPQQTFDSLRKVCADREILAPPFLRITRTPPKGARS